MVKVITYGTFDLFHKGHYRLLKRAKALGDYLIVGVCSEEYDKARGKLNVVDPLLTRIKNVVKTGFADEVIVEEFSGQKYNDIKKYNVDIFTVGSDWVGQFDYLSAYCKVVYLERTKNISSTMLREKAAEIHRVGIIGSGRIAARFVPEVKLVSGISTQGVFNPHVESAKAFAERFQIEHYGDMDAFFENIDAVYVASPHGTHYGYIKEALENGKHVLSEKPMVLKRGEAEELFALAKSKDLVLMEGIKTAYCPGFLKLLGIVFSGAIGEVRCVDACFTKLESPGSRELTDERYGGSFMELGSYCMLPIMKIFGTGYEDVRFDSIRAENGLDLFTRAYFKYGKGIAAASCGLGVKSEGKLLVSGTKGYIIVEAPWWKTDYFEIHYEDAAKVEKYSDRFLGDGLRYEVSDFVSSINGNGKSRFKLSRDEIIALSGVMEAFIGEAGRL